MRSIYFVYILYSNLLDRYYTGVSTNPKKRLFYHNLGKSGSKNAFTKRANDWDIVYQKLFVSKADALSFERRIKKQKSKKFIVGLIKSGKTDKNILHN